MLNKTVRSVIAAAHLSFKISRQIAPVTDARKKISLKSNNKEQLICLQIFGCQIRVVKRTFGALKGYVSGLKEKSIQLKAN